MLGDTAGRIPGRLWSLIRNSGRRRGCRRRPRQAGLEQLEPRVVLDSNLAILGTVFWDRNEDGRPSEGEGLSDVAVQLYQDKAPFGSFQLDRDELLVEKRSSSTGQYVFDNLSPDLGYFVRRPAQTVQTGSDDELKLPTVISPLLRPGAPGLIIDQFQTRQSAIADPPAPSQGSSTLQVSLNSPEVLGSVRELQTKLERGVGSVELCVNPFGLQELLEFNYAPSTIGTSLVTWDGVAADAEQVSMGLDDLDLTNGGRITGLVLRGGVDASGAGTEVRLRIYEGSATNFSEAIVKLPVTGGEPTGFVPIPFDTFTGPVRPTKVDAIQMEISGGSEGSDGKIDLVGGLGPTVFNISEVVTADLSVTKSNERSIVVPGQKLEYTIWVFNTGPNPVEGARVSDIFPTTLTEIVYSSTASVGASGNRPTGQGSIDDLVNLDVGSWIKYVVNATVRKDAQGAVDNIVEVAVPAGVYDPNMANNTARDRDPIGIGIDLQATKDDGRRVVMIGEVLTYTMVVTNHGPGPALGARATDFFPDTLDGISYISRATAGVSGHTPSGTGDIDDTLNMPEKGQVTYTVMATVSDRAVGTLENRVTVAAPPDRVELTPENNDELDTNLVTRAVADVYVTKGNSVTQLVPGNPVTYTIVVGNLGPAHAADVRFVDDFPEELVDVKYTSRRLTGTPIGNTSSGQGPIDDVLMLPAGSSVLYTVTGTVLASARGTLTNTATATLPLPIDPDLENNSATDTDQLVPTADLRITKSDGLSQINPGESLTYTIVVQNAGPSDAGQVRIRDAFPPELTDVQYVRNLQGGLTQGAGNLDDQVELAAGQSVTYIVQATVNPTATGSLRNTATVEVPDGVVDPNPLNNSATDITSISRRPVDLMLRKLSAETVAVPGGRVHYTLVVSNIGQTDVAGAVVTDNFAQELLDVTYTSEVVGVGGGNTSPGTGNIQDTIDLAAGSSIIYSIQGRIASGAQGSLRNLAQVDLPGLTDPTPGNNIDLTVVPLVAHADLSVTKSDGRAEVEVGDLVTYEIVVQNAGPSDVRGVSVTDLVPAGLRQASYTSSGTAGVTGNTPAGNGSIRDLVQLPAGSTLTYVLTGTVAADVSGVLVNTARVAGPIDPSFVEHDPTNNVATDVNSLASIVSLGSEPTVIYRDAIVHPGMTDRYRITAHSSGKLLIGALFDHAQGDLTLAVDDRWGNQIAIANGQASDERLAIPVVSQQTYYIRVFGAAGTVTNRYDLEVENFAVPVPEVFRLTPQSDTGWRDDDAITADGTPTILIQADLEDFVGHGLQILEPTDPAADNSTLPAGAGLAVEVVLTHTVTGNRLVGFASSLDDEGALVSFTPRDPDALESGLYAVTAAIRVVDATTPGGELPPSSGRGLLSAPYGMTIDRVAPATTDRPDLLDASDTGASLTDNVTSRTQPALQGTGEPNAKVRLLVRRESGPIEVVGQGVVTVDGRWEITVEPLAEGRYEVRAEFEDLAGNVGNRTEPLLLTVDTTSPNTPYLDLLPSSDTGLSGSDQVTAASTPAFSMTTHDPVISAIESRFNYWFRIYIRPDAPPGGDPPAEQLIYDSSRDLQIPLVNLIDGLTDLTQLTRSLGPLPDGVHNLKLEVEDRAGNVSQDYLLTVTIDTQVPQADSQLLDSSDSGTYSDDRVTRIQQPALGGISEVGANVSLYANGKLVGRAVVGSDETDGVANDGRGAWQVTAQPLDDGAYVIQALLEDQAGNFRRSENLNLIVDTRPPNIPLLRLLTDSGIDPSDNVTRDNTPTITLTIGATVAGGANARPNDIRYRVYDRPGDDTGEVLLIDSFGALRGLSELGFFTETLPPLADGVHNLKVEVEDRAGNVSQAFLRDITIDTSAPPANLPTLIPSSDSGLNAQDRVTRITSPAFKGLSSVGETVYLFANGSLIGQGQVGSDETDGVPGNGLGAWEITVEPLADGQYDIVAHVEDRAGNFSRSEPLRVWIDATPPNQPLLQLADDLGLDETDGIISDKTPTVTVTANDTLDGGANPFPHDVVYRIYDRTGAAAERLLVDSFDALGGFSEQGLFTVTLPELSEGSHNLKLVVEDRAGNRGHEFLLAIRIDATAPDIGPIRMAQYSDSGASDQDRVTNIRQPAILGTASVGGRIWLRANGEIVGQTVVGSDDSDGVPGDRRGAWEITVEPLDDNVYTLVAQVQDQAGNTAESSSLQIEIDTLAPNTPFLDLRESDDTGRHNDDNITSAERVVFSATSSDANAELHAVLVPGGQNFVYRVFARPEFGQESLVYSSATDPSLTNLLNGLTAQSRVSTLPLQLPQGLHNLKLEVEDRAGNISADYLQSLLIDRTGYAGTARLHPDSDSGVAGVPGSVQDGITNVRTPRFVGTAEADALVTMTIDGQPAGTTVAVPLDGDDAVQPPNLPYAIEGNWQMTSSRALTDGVHTVVFTYEDPAGNRLTSTLQLTVDTGGPQILNVTQNVVGFPSLFDPKPASGPDPLIDSLVIHIGDGSGSSAGGASSIPASIAGEEGHYRLVGDANGAIAIRRVEVLAPAAGSPSPVTQIILHFVEPLPDDRFTLTVFDAITDAAGNHLDGESGAHAPFEGSGGLQPVSPIFPTGDGVPGGDFVARFTIDSRPELATWAAGDVWVDINGNWIFDPQNQDVVNRDIVFKYGFTSDDIFAGNFALGANDTTDGYDKLACYGRHDGKFRWLVDTDNDGVPNIDREESREINGLPAAGRFDDNDDNGDEVAVFDGNTWYFDTNHDFITDQQLTSSLVGYPVVGDFDGDGFDDLATWANDRFMIDLANGSRRGWDGVADHTFNFGYIGVRERPVAADLNQDGVDDLGLWVPNRQGVTPHSAAEWYFLVSSGRSLLRRLSPQDDPINSWPTIDFTPRPFGQDVYAQFGDDFALPIVGNFDPPTTSLYPKDQQLTNPVNPLDVNGDQHVSPVDALLIVNELNQIGARRLSDRVVGTPHLDVNQDGFVSSVDALLVLNELNGVTQARTRSWAAVVREADAAAALAADGAFAEQSEFWSDEYADLSPTKLKRVAL